jgi:EAL domain-containing protein (putative c-di-GMP-specific phosphodiesterase class I)
LRHANFALSEAKESHHAWMSFGKHLKTKMNKKITIEKDLKEALQHNQFFCLFQPQINLSSKTLFGFEVLIRWQHPSAGVIIPSDFIPIAEKMGLAEKINQYLLHYVLSRLGRFKPHQKRLTISVNISPCVIHFEQHINELINIVNHYQLPKNLSLTFEITESEFLGNINEKDPLLKKVKRQLKQHNISLAIDDFGKDQSSFNRLVQCQFDILKIDKAFIDHLHKNNTLATAIIKAILTMSKELNISVIAEGVENKSQLNCLKKLGSTIIQGYYYYRPLLENDALELLHKPSLH